MLKDKDDACPIENPHFVGSTKLTSIVSKMPLTNMFTLPVCVVVVAVAVAVVFVFFFYAQSGTQRWLPHGAGPRRLWVRDCSHIS